MLASLQKVVKVGCLFSPSFIPSTARTVQLRGSPHATRDTRQSKTLSVELIELGLESGLGQLEDDHHRVRREALLLVAPLTPTDPANAVHAQAILSRFTSDTDFRVRMVPLRHARHARADVREQRRLCE